jgi:hypothetical protein
MFKVMSEEIETTFKVISITENLKEAKNILEVFLSVYDQEQKEEILKELEKRDSRFIGWNSSYTFDYLPENVTGDTLYIGRGVSRMIKEKKLKIKLFLYEEV